LTSKKTSMSLNTSQKIVEQVEFYFSNSNLPKDAFLRAIVANHPEGYVPIETIASFKRMKMITQKEEEPLKTVVDALKTSKKLQVDKEEKLVRRTEPLPEVDDSDERTLCLSGFPTSDTLDTIKSKLEIFGKVACIRMMKDKETKNFSGKAFIEFETKESLNAFNEINLLTSKTKDDLKKEREEKKKLRDKKREEFSKEKLEKDIQSYRVEKNYKTGSLLKITGVDKLNVERKNVRSLFEPFGEIGFIDYPLGQGNDADQSQGIIRFKSPESTEKIMEAYKKDTNAFLLGEVKEPVNLEILKGDAEDGYFRVIVETRYKRFKGKRKFGGRKYGGKNKKRRY